MKKRFAADVSRGAKTTAFILALFCFCLRALALEPGDHALTFKSAYDDSTQPYRLFIPSAAKSGQDLLPLVVVLHGKGGNQNKWFDRLQIKTTAEKNGYIVAAPHSRGNMFYRGPGEQDVLDMIAEVKRLCRVDNNRVYLIGHSMGGCGTWWIALRNQDLFAAICPMAGWAPMELLPNARNMAPLIIHGDADKVVEVELSRLPAQRLAQLGISFQYREEPGYGHDNDMINDNLPLIFEWLGQHRRVERPLRVNLTASTSRHGRAYWLWIVENKYLPKPATIEARLETGKTGTNLVIKTDGVRRLAVNRALMPAGCDSLSAATINAKPMELPKKEGWIMVTLDDSGAPVKAQPVDEKTLASSREDEIAVVSDDLRKGNDPMPFATAIALLMREETGADFGVIISDMCYLPPAPLTADKILDIPASPVEQLVSFECDGETILKLKVSDAKLRKPWWGKLAVVGPDTAVDPGRNYRVVAPEDIPLFLKKPYKAMNETMGEFFFRALAKRKSL